MGKYVADIEKDTTKNSNFRDVVHTADRLQLVLMSLKPGEDIGAETHPRTDQFFRFEEGKGEVMIGKEWHKVKAGNAVIIPAGTEHNVINTSKLNDLKFYTLYSMPMHKDGLVAKTKEEAIKKE